MKALVRPGVVSRRARWTRCFAAMAVMTMAAASEGIPFAPGTVYDPSIPTMKRVLGYETGEKITAPADIPRYLRALEAASNKIKVFSIGRSWEGRELVYAFIGSEANIARLDEIKAKVRQLADPRKTDEGAARALMADLPAVVSLSCSVHGNEISPSDAGIAVAYHLLAAQNDPVAGKILENVLLILDPLQNPDGRQRFLANFEQSLGLEPDASPLSAERKAPWPGGRGNHYLFDLNRDWLIPTQPESKARISMLREWMPLVFVDLHEMDSDNTYYFAPGAEPFNPWLVPYQRESLDWFGKNNAKYFDANGLNYFTREIFDSFFPGYGDSWPSYYGAIAMTYEQRTSRGLRARTRDGREFDFASTIKGHFLSSIATLETSAGRRMDLLTQFRGYRKSAVEEGRTGAVTEYILPREHDTSSVDKLAAVLHFHGLEVKRARAAFRNGGREFPAGSYVVPAAQPGSRLARVLLEKQVSMDDEFLKEQERLRHKKLGDQIYDVTAWSLPLLYNVEAVPVKAASAGDFEDWDASKMPAGRVHSSVSPIAYLVPWGTAASGRFLTAALRRDIRLMSLDKPAVQNGRAFPRGTLVARTADNGPGLARVVGELATESGAEVIATDTGWVESGINFGSALSFYIPKVRVAIAWDVPTIGNAAGASRFVLERQFSYPVTAIRTRDLISADLSRYDTLILPSALGSAYDAVLGEAGIGNLKRWVESGGTLIGIGRAVEFLRSEKTGLLHLKRELGAGHGPSAEARAESSGESGDVAGSILATEREYMEAIKPNSALPDASAGILLRAKVDTDHWLSAGCERGVNVIYLGNTIYAPLKLDEGVNVGYFDAPGNVFQSGYVWRSLRKQLAFKPFLVSRAVGRGNVIGFITDPNFRAVMDGNNLLFLNAVFRGPAHSRRAGGD